jgi:hypothetical protein
MSFSAWEQQALDSIKNELAGSDPELAALVSAFNRLASDEEMPNREKIQAGSRRAFRRLRRARWRSSLRSVCRRLGLQRAVMLLWLLTTAALIAVALALNAGDHGTCAETVPIACIAPSPEHSPGSSWQNTTTGQVSQQRISGIPQAGPP